MHARKNIHQRCLAGAVFSQDTVDFSGMKIQVDIVVGDHAWEGLGNADQLNEGFIRRHSNSGFHLPTPTPAVLAGPQRRRVEGHTHR